MRAIWLCAISAATLFAQANPRDLVRESIRNGEQSWRRSFDYYCIKRDVDREFDSGHRVKSVSDDVYEVIPLGFSTSFDKLIRHNNEPVSRDRRLKAEEELRARQQEAPDAKRRRFDKQLSERSYMKEVADAFDFRITGEEQLPTGPAWVLEATPRPGYQPRSRYAHMFPKMRGRLWIDKKDRQWVKADAVAADTVTFGFFIARLAKGSHIRIEQMRLPDGDWVAKRITAAASARTFVFFNHNFEEDITYSDYSRTPPSLSAAK